MNLFIKALILLVLFNRFQYSIAKFEDLLQRSCNETVLLKHGSLQLVPCIADKYGFHPDIIKKDEVPKDKKTCCGYYEFICAVNEIVTTLCEPNVKFFDNMVLAHKNYTENCKNTNRDICQHHAKSDDNDECKEYNRGYFICKGFQWSPNSPESKVKIHIKAMGCGDKELKKIKQIDGCIDEKIVFKSTDRFTSNRGAVQCCNEYQKLCIQTHEIQKSCKPKPLFYEMIDKDYKNLTKTCEKLKPTKDLCTKYYKVDQNKTCEGIDTYSECDSYSWNGWIVGKGGYNWNPSTGSDGIAPVDGSSTILMYTPKPPTSGTLSSFSELKSLFLCLSLFASTIVFVEYYY